MADYLGEGCVWCNSLKGCIQHPQGGPQAMSSLLWAEGLEGLVALAVPSMVEEEPSW
eukprot:CAMPEP_0206589606 /NCGR_PEP_ID=MMETSP0325_2-20121206/39034_1 /ASSEMBLY_ACC=CAM_ASM_000347 /TAXON_ID=2866 /ORGANISM="Crypthecodinium cohnii, Strain Seligo" /LENGTH=56 /DNA_ID=CAMNT_0054098219 /DNA_START=47 /DNA_END=217 /DNA_ORIENTATION=-